jgi:hypothetical protein
MRQRDKEALQIVVAGLLISASFMAPAILAYAFR